jgi:hypothetical protein
MFFAGSGLKWTESAILIQASPQCEVLSSKNNMMVVLPLQQVWMGPGCGLAIFLRIGEGSYREPEICCLYIPDLLLHICSPSLSQEPKYSINILTFF